MNWINNLNATHKGWNCYEDPCIGVLTWYLAAETNFQVLATPNWEGNKNTPIAYMSDHEEYRNLGTLKQYKFKTFEEYAIALQPFLDIALTIYINEQLNSYEMEE